MAGVRGGLDYDESLKAADRTKTDVEVFKSESFRDLNEIIDFLKKFTMAEHFLENTLPTLHFSTFDSKYCFSTSYRADIVGDKNCAIIDKPTAREVLECYEFVKKEFEKRLETYLKKYGLSKLKVWTYCADD